MNSEDEMKKFIPEAILEEDPIVNFKLEPTSPEDLVSSSFINDIDSPMEEDEDFRGFKSIDNSDHSMELIESVNGEEQVIVVMDIREPLTTLRKLLEEKVGYPLNNCSFSLQAKEMIDLNENLVELCNQEEGIVEYNCEIKRTNEGCHINIADVLKPSENLVEIGSEEDEIGAFGGDGKWVVDHDFKRDQEKLGIAQNPSKWNVEQVRHWLMWAVRQFSLSGIILSEWELKGEDLLKMTREQFLGKVPEDANNSFWVHFQLLRNCKIVAKKPEEPNYSAENHEEDNPPNDKKKELEKEKKLKKEKRYFKMTRMAKQPTGQPAEVDFINLVEPNNDDQASSNLGSGPVQLWQFLLELLTNRHHRNAIQWLDEEGEFKLINPELVAHLWGIRKHKPTMNYEKLSRALRYYYDGEMISKVNGKRFTYKFVCDLKQLIGFSAGELNIRVVEAELKDKFLLKTDDSNSNQIFVNDFISLIP